MKGAAACALCWLVLAVPPSQAALCAGFDPTLGLARFHAWQNQPQAVLAVINKAKASGAVCPESTAAVELARIEALLRAGQRHRAALALQALGGNDIRVRGPVAVLMADLAYLDGRLDETAAWLERAGSNAQDLGERAEFLRAEVARAEGRFEDALEISTHLPRALASYVRFNVAAGALAAGQTDLALEAARALAERPVYAPAPGPRTSGQKPGKDGAKVASAAALRLAPALDLRERARLLYASALVAASDPAGAAAVLDGMSAQGLVGQAALAERVRLALMLRDGPTIDRLAGYLPAGEGDLARAYVLETAGAMAPARARYVAALDGLEARAADLRRIREQPLETAAALLDEKIDLRAAPASVARFLASPETMDLLLAVRGIDGRLTRLNAAAKTLDVLAAVAAEQDRRAKASAARAETLDIEARLSALNARLAATDPAGREDPWMFANARERAYREDLQALVARADAARRPDLVHRAERLLGRLTWDLEWQYFDRRYAAMQRHARLRSRAADLGRRLDAALALAGEARHGGIHQARIAALGAAIDTARSSAASARQAAASNLARLLEHWADEQLERLDAVRSYATLAVARTGDRLLSGGDMP